MSVSGLRRRNAHVPSLANTEPTEDFAEQIIAREFACDPAELQMCEAQLLCEELPAVDFGGGLREMLVRGGQRAQMTLPRQEYRLARRRPARGVENGAAQLLQSCAGLRGYRDGAGLWSKPRM